MVGGDPGEAQLRELLVLGKPRRAVDHFLKRIVELDVRRARDLPAALQGVVALGPRLEKKDGRQQVEVPQGPEDLAVGREPPAAALLLVPLAGKLLHTAVEPSLVQKGHEPARRVEKERVEGHRPPSLLDDDAFLPRRPSQAAISRSFSIVAESSRRFTRAGR